MPRDTSVSVEEISFLTSDNARLVGDLYRPAGKPGAAVLVTGGTGFPQRTYARVARYMADRGALVLTFDYRDIARSRSGDLARSQTTYTDWGRYDMPAALDTLLTHADGLPVGHLAHSVGGHFAGFMPNHDRINRHAFVAVGSGYWPKHFRRYNPVELFFWFVLGPVHLRRRGYVAKGRFWRGEDLPRGVYTTWRNWCLKADYFAGDLTKALKPHYFDAVQSPIRNWIFRDDPIANTRTAPDIMRCYPAAKTEIILREPADYGVDVIGHDRMFRKGLETLWAEWFEWLVHGAPGSTPGGSDGAKAG